MDGKDVLKFAATGMSGIFAGAAFCILLLLLDGSMAGLGSLAAATVCYLDKDSDTRYLWGIGATAFISIWPWTMIAMMPDIKKLLADDVLETAGETWVRTHIDRWNRLHMVRTVLSVSAFGIFLYALYKK